MGKTENLWERTNATNLLRNRESGNYYARVKVKGKQKWRSLKTTVFSVAKLRLGDAEKELRAEASVATAEARAAGIDEMQVGYFIALFRQRTSDDASLAPATKERRATAIKAVETTWPELPSRDIRRIGVGDCREWAARALREGTGFVAPRAKTVRRGMSASAFNKAVDALRGVFEIARKHGVVYRNPAAEIPKAPLRRKRLDLPTVAQFEAVLRHMAAAGSRWSADCADLARLLAYSGARLEEGTSIRWLDIDWAKNELRLRGTKTETSNRIVPLFPALAALLKNMRARRGEEPPDALVAKVGSCLGALRSACAAVGVPRMSHHDLRHLFATRCIESGVDIPTVSKWLGHSDGGTLAMATYGHLRQEHSQTQALKVAF